MTDTTDTSQTTADEPVNNTVATPSATDTDTAQDQGTPVKTFTQADVDRIVQNRLKTAVKAELKKLTGDDKQPSVEEVQKQLSDLRNENRSLKARDTVNEYLADGRNKLNVKSENLRGIQALVIPLLEYDEEGKVTNLKDAVESAKSIAPALFASSTSNINANNGNNQPVTSRSMNDFIRQAAGYGN